MRFSLSKTVGRRYMGPEKNADRSKDETRMSGFDKLRLRFTVYRRLFPYRGNCNIIYSIVPSSVLLLINS